MAVTKAGKKLYKFDTQFILNIFDRNYVLKKKREVSNSHERVTCLAHHRTSKRNFLKIYPILDEIRTITLCIKLLQLFSSHRYGHN